MRDEATRLGACLDALLPFVDEIVVCDTGSTDSTVAIAQASGATVVEYEWQHHFADARNRALGASSTDWVLSVDADEVAEGVAAWLQVMLAACASELDALWVQIDNSSCPDVSGIAVHREIRLFQRLRCRWVGRVHEKVVSLTAGAVMATANLPAQTLQLVHHGYDERMVAAMKAIRNAELAALQLSDDLSGAADDTVVARSALDLGRSYLGAGRPELALDPLSLAQQLGDSDTQHWARHFLARTTASAAPRRGGLRKEAAGSE